MPVKAFIIFKYSIIPFSLIFEAAVADGAIKHLLGNGLSFPQEDNEGENEFEFCAGQLKIFTRGRLPVFQRSCRLRDDGSLVGIT